MIQSLKFNPVSFKGNTDGNSVQTSEVKSNPAVQRPDEFMVSKNQFEENEKTEAKESKAEDVVEKKSIKQKISDLGDKAVNILKKTKKTIQTTKGTLVGIRDGVIAAGAVAFVGKNIQEGKGQIGATIVAMGKNIVNAAKTVATKTIPYVWNASPKNIMKGIVHLPKAFFKYCSSGVEQGAKHSKTVGALAATVGAGVLGFNIIKGIAKGNQKSADVDHYTDRGHIKTK